MTATARRAGTLHVRNLGWLPHGRETPVLSEVSLDIRPGERVLLAGPSGSGKSTLLKAIAGLLDDSIGEQSGEVRLGDAVPGEVPGRVGLLLQDPFHAIVAEHAGRDAAFGPENRALPRAEVRRRAAAALTEVSFPYGADRATGALSGGQLHRLGLAGSLALDPEVLLLDEPTAMLDDTSAAQVRGAVQRTAADRGLTLVVVEHQLAGWVEVCDRMVVLSEDGRVLADGPTEEVLASAADALLEAGVWVPGAPPPAALPIDSEESAGAVRKPAGRGPDGADPGVMTGGGRLDLDDLAVANPDGSGSLVRGLDLHLGSGRAAAVLGPSGSGKSTLLRTVAGLEEPTAGAVNRTGELAWLPQQAELMITRRTVLDEVLATPRARFGDDPERLAQLTRRADRVLARLRLDHLRDADPWTLSGGELRRLALAAVVTHQPRVVLLDEPTVGQDRHTWAAVVGVVQALRREGAVVLAGTHDATFADRLGQAVRLAPLDGDQPEPAPDHRLREVIPAGTSPAGRCNPLAALLIALGGAVGSFFVDDWRTGLVLLGVILALAPLGVRRPRAVLVRLVPVGVAALTVGWSTWLLSPAGFLSTQALPVAATEVLRILCLVLPGAVLVAEISPSRLSDALAQRLRLPARPVVAAGSALLRLQHLLDTWRQLAEVRTLRGLNPGRSPSGRVRHVASMTFALLISTFRASGEMALAMDARGFAAARVRTFALPSPWRARDGVCCLVAAVLVLVPILVG